MNPHRVPGALYNSVYTAVTKEQTFMERNSIVRLHDSMTRVQIFIINKRKYADKVVVLIYHNDGWIEY